MSLGGRKILAGWYVLSVYLWCSPRNEPWWHESYAQAWEITLYPKAVPSNCVLGKTVLSHLLPVVALPSVPLSRAGTSTSGANVLSASPSTGKLSRSSLEISWHKGRHMLTTRKQHHFCDEGVLDPLRRLICYGPMCSGITTEGGRFHPLFSMCSLWTELHRHCQKGVRPATETV